MVYTIYTLKFTRYLHGNFLYRVHGRWRKCFPITKESREQLNNAVFKAYEQALSQNQGQSQKQEPPEPEQAPGMTMSM